MFVSLTDSFLGADYVIQDDRFSPVEMVDLCFVGLTQNRGFRNKRVVVAWLDAHSLLWPILKSLATEMRRFDCNFRRPEVLNRTFSD